MEEEEGGGGGGEGGQAQGQLVIVRATAGHVHKEYIHRIVCKHMYIFAE